ncbi:nuclear transport factor 2 family protein [Flagellimonas profundi]|uniref:Nuclear transport factor 2 family protein n=1 Tax=Flagellimonas profundi TaxID=2915620 RepID=A0ABS3FK01_9FLAO|nr:nuclear transport factor 2 family protein [Allomuricauda profundi]MBO0343489.1 nuclear transport factor 2 family protein [Allomuricauda profundi]
MKILQRPLIILILIMSIAACKKSKEGVKEESVENTVIIEKEKQAILESLRTETEDAFNRDYQAWRTNWVHQPSVVKTYMNFADSSFSEMLGWREVDDFVKTYIKEHPEPVPTPVQPDNVTIQVFGTGAWVSYRTFDETFGNKRETRLMVKEAGQWKIAGMHTTIYGFEPVR